MGWIGDPDLLGPGILLTNRGIKGWDRMTEPACIPRWTSTIRMQ